MRGQFFLFATAIIITALLFATGFFGSYSHIHKFTSKNLASNFENEVVYIANHFNYSDIGDYVEKFANYSKLMGYNFSFICWANENVSLPPCSGQSKNCCHYFPKNQIFEIPKFKVTLYPVKSWICFNYWINKSGEKYEGFFCT
jgi:hypothetical protein